MLESKLNLMDRSEAATDGGGAIRKRCRCLSRERTLGCLRSRIEEMREKEGWQNLVGRKLSGVLYLCTSDGGGVADVAIAVGARSLVLHPWSSGRQVSRITCQGPARADRQGCT